MLARTRTIALLAMSTYPISSRRNKCLAPAWTMLRPRKAATMRSPITSSGQRPKEWTMTMIAAAAGHSGQVVHPCPLAAVRGRLRLRADVTL